MKRTLSPFILLLLAAMAFSFHACVDQDFDEPPRDGEDPNLTANTTISQVKALYNGISITEITDDIIIEGIVTADDQSGNFYKKIVMEDASGGMEILLDFTEVYNDYPVGRRIFIKCKGLFLDNYNDVVQLGGYVYDSGGSPRLGGIPLGTANDFIFPGMRNQTVPLTMTNIGDLTLGDISRLVQLDNVEFISGETGVTYADNVNFFSVNRNVTDCANNTLIVRTSGYADFAGQLTPGGNGSITGIVGAFGGDLQLYIRDLNDVDMTADRCTGGGGSTGNETQVNIGDIRSTFNGGGLSVPANSKIVGTVISDRVNGNINGQNVVVQDATGGVLVRFDADHGLNLNDEVEIVVSNQELSEYNGLLQVNNVPAANATVTGTGGITPAIMTIADVMADFDNLESTLVRIENASLSGGTTYAGALTLDDGTNSITVYTAGGASFAGATAPTSGQTVAMTAIVGDFNGPQLAIRNLDDVTADGGNPMTCQVDENFQGGTDFDPVQPTGWTNTAEVGTEQWIYKSFSGDVFAEMRSYQAVSPENVAWLVTPAIDLSTEQIMTFESEMAFWAHDGLTVWIANDFAGDVTDATWVPVTATLAGQANANYEAVPSGDINLYDYFTSGTAHVAFRYEGTSAANTTTYRIDDLRICEP
jgi:hypothetical protein